MKLSFTTLGCPNWTLEQIATNAKAYGYDGIELRVQVDGNHFSPDAPPEEARRVGDFFRAAGVPVISLMGYTTFAHLEEAKVAENQVLMRKLIKIAENMGVSYIRSFCGRLPAGTTSDQMAQVIGKALKPLAQEAASKKITIGIETHDDWCSGERLLKVIQYAEASKGLGVVYDIFNAFNAKIEPWDVTYRQVKKHIIYCHLKDGYNKPDGKPTYYPMGAGDMPLVEMLQTLKKDGYDGFLSFEWEKKWIKELEEPERVFPHYARKVRQLWGA